jgi:DmsE family decaheme c-type cytochrome
VPMTKHSKKLGMWVWLLVLPLLQLGAGNVFAQEPPAASAAAPAAVSDYLGSEACKVCHEDHYTDLADTPHYATRLDTRGGMSRQLCEACHGPGRAHVAGGGDRSKIFIFKERTPVEVNKRCLTCHSTGPNRLNSANSFHRQNQVSCIDCHSPHRAKTKEKLLVKAMPELCLSCHLQQKSQFNMPFRHRVLEGLITCTDCHDQHGTDEGWESDHLVRQVRTSANGDYVCFKCHKDKQGPFVYQHAAVKVEGCAACHIPHGGANPHMLRYSNVDLQCLQCHTAAAFGHSQAGTAPTTGFPVMTAQESNQQQACTLCHVAIHGSNFNSLFFR